MEFIPRSTHLSLYPGLLKSVIVNVVSDATGTEARYSNFWEGELDTRASLRF